MGDAGCPALPLQILLPARRHLLIAHDSLGALEAGSATFVAFRVRKVVVFFLEEVSARQ